ncbi:MAG: DUF2341 domain-containing protein, partial [Bacteroidota bacterium]|nr:DUF2341 domain-containing protein [Bacteroidota bacterium]
MIKRLQIKQYSLAMVIVLALAQLVQGQSWYNNSWLYRRAITIDNTKVGSGPHTNFPMLVNTVDTNLQKRALSTGNDILFTSSNGTTKLDHEIESYTGTSGALVAWVEIPSLPSSSSTVIYMYFGNSSATSQQNITGTWDGTFSGVYHLNNSFLDATINNRDGTNTGTTNLTGKISNGRGFVRSNGTDFITISGLMGSPTTFTLSGWANLTTADPSGSEIISIGDYSMMRYDESSDNRTCGITYTKNNSWSTTGSGNNYAGTGWHYVTYTFDNGGNSQKLYIDGIVEGTNSFSQTPLYTGLGSNTIIGKHGDGNTNMDFDGSIDEVRVASSARSAGWVLTEYNNQNSPSTFYSLGLQSYVFKIWDGGAGTANWGDANNWLPDGVPTSSDMVHLNGANTININVAAVSNYLILDHDGLILTIKAGNSLTISGNLSHIKGTLNTEATFPTVTGTVNISGGTIGFTGSVAQTVPVLGYNNLTISGSSTKTLAGTIGIDGNLTISSGTFDLTTFTANRNTIGGTLTVGNGATIKIGGTGTLPSSYSTHLIGMTSTIEYSGTTQSIASLNSAQKYGNLTISGSLTKTLIGSETVEGTLTLTAGILAIGANTLALNGAISTASGTLAGGSSSNIIIGGSGASTTLPSVILNNLTLNRANGITTTNVTVNGTLSLLNGLLTPSSGGLTIGSVGIISGASSARYINGKLNFIYNTTGTKTFPIGKGGNYRPLSINYVSLTGVSTVSAEQLESTIPGSIPIGVTVQSGRYWAISQAGGLGFVYSITLDGTPFTPGTDNPVILKGDGITNTAISATFSNPNFLSTGLTSYGNFAVGSECIKPQGSLTANGPFCATGTGQLTWTASAGTGPFTIIYNDGITNRTMASITSGSPFSVFTTPVTSTTTYTLVSVTSANGCVRTTGF